MFEGTPSLDRQPVEPVAEAPAPQQMVEPEKSEPTPEQSEYVSAQREAIKKVVSDLPVLEDYYKLYWAHQKAQRDSIQSSNILYTESARDLEKIYTQAGNRVADSLSGLASRREQLGLEDAFDMRLQELILLHRKTKAQLTYLRLGLPPHNLEKSFIDGLQVGNAEQITNAEKVLADLTQDTDYQEELLRQYIGTPNGEWNWRQTFPKDPNPRDNAHYSQSV